MAHPIWFNGNLVPYEDAKVHVLTHALHYGSSVFEGIRCYHTEHGSAVFRLQEHVRRLVDSATIYRMEVGWSTGELIQAVLHTVQESGLKECYIRPLVFRGMGALGINPLTNPVETIIAVWEWGKYLGDDALTKGVDVHVASWNRMAPNTHPALAKAGGNYLNASLVKMNAVLSGYIEGIMLTHDGFVAEGSGENLFVIRDNELFTAALSASILPGITRDAIITIARDRGYEVHETTIPREALYVADELFFTGTAAEVTPIRTVDRYHIGSGRAGPITRELQRAFFDVVKRGNDPYGWLSFVDQPVCEKANLF